MIFDKQNNFLRLRLNLFSDLAVKMLWYLYKSKEIIHPNKTGIINYCTFVLSKFPIQQVVCVSESNPLFKDVISIPTKAQITKFKKELASDIIAFDNLLSTSNPERDYIFIPDYNLSLYTEDDLSPTSKVNYYDYGKSPIRNLLRINRLSASQIFFLIDNHDRVIQVPKIYYKILACLLEDGDTSTFDQSYVSAIKGNAVEKETLSLMEEMDNEIYSSVRSYAANLDSLVNGDLMKKFTSELNLCKSKKDDKLKQLEINSTNRCKDLLNEIEKIRQTI